MANGDVVSLNQNDYIAIGICLNLHPERTNLQCKSIDFGFNIAQSIFPTVHSFCMKYKTTFCWFTVHLHTETKENIRAIDEKTKFSWSIRQSVTRYPKTSDGDRICKQKNKLIAAKCFTVDICNQRTGVCKKSTLNVREKRGSCVHR